MRVLDIPQRSDAWFRARVGRLTGSRAAAVLATLKNGGEPAARRDLRIQLACERLTGRSAEDSYQSADMRRGILRESDALNAYEAATGTIITPVGFIEHDELSAGCSPDGLVDDDGLVEIKCPKSTQHLMYLVARSVPADYLGQVVHNLWITGRAWCDFVSFDDRFPPPLQLVIVRFRRDAAAIAAYELQARQFLRDVDKQADIVAALMPRELEQAF